MSIYHPSTNTFDTDDKAIKQDLEVGICNAASTYSEAAEGPNWWDLDGLGVCLLPQPRCSSSLVAT